MPHPRGFVVTFIVAAILGTAGTAAAYHTRFVADNCNYAAPTTTSYITRDGSAAVALRARYEGYQWAGGCWNDNDRDDSPNDPHEDPATGGEGGDCSGFTFKVWRESLDQSDAGFAQWGLLRNVHGPYTAAAFKAGAGAPNVTVSKTALTKMDALASDTHVGLIYAVNPDGTDQIIEPIWAMSPTGRAVRPKCGESKEITLPSSNLTGAGAVSRATISTTRSSVTKNRERGLSTRSGSPSTLSGSTTIRSMIWYIAARMACTSATSSGEF
jgi:hypothetical protein